MKCFPSLNSHHGRPSVALMILNYNGLRWLKICLPSVLRSTYPNLEIYVVDNGSWDGSCEFVQSNYPRVRLVRFAENLGFAKAYNPAIARVKAEYVILLNNDTVVLNPGWIALLVDQAERDPVIAVVGCKLVTLEDHRVLDSVGGMGIKYWRGFVDIGRYEVDRGQYDRPIIPLSACGAAMLVRRDTFMQVGGFDPRFYAYLEDVDLCWRLRLLGYGIIYEPSARVAHYFSGTHKSKDVDAHKLYLSHRNLLRAIIKNCRSSLIWALRNYLLFAFIVTAGDCILDPVRALALLKAILWNLLCFPDTYARRLLIQSSATTDDLQILATMYPNFSRYQPGEHRSLGHILDILFEQSQSVQHRTGRIRIPATASDMRA